MLIQLYSVGEAINAEVSDSDYDSVKDIKWRLAARGKRKYVLGKIRTQGGYHDMYLHHYLLGQEKGFRIRFKDGNGLNNTRCNLEVQELRSPSKLLTRVVYGPPTRDAHGRCIIYMKGDVAAAVVDEHRWHSLAGVQWGLSEGYASRTAIYMHRVVAGAKSEETVDHINGNRLDNRESNLRVATRGQQSQNRMKKANKVVSGYIGVSKQCRGGNWYARMVYQGKTHCLGTYVLPIDAAFAYDCKARELYGPHGKTNEIPLTHVITTKL